MNHFSLRYAILVMGIFLGAVFTFCYKATAVEDCGGIEDSISHGGVLWTENAIIVQGTAAPGLTKKKNMPISIIKRSAQRAATLDAYRKIAAVLSGVRVTSESLAVDSAKVVTKIQAYVRQAKICKAKYYADGGVDIVVMVPLSGEFTMDQLSDAGTEISTTESMYTGMVIDASNLHFEPALAPRLLSADGKVLFSHKKVKKEVFMNRGSVFYTKEGTVPNPSIVGDNPLKAKAIGLGTLSPSDLIIDPESAAILSNHPEFLRDGKVSIITKSPDNPDCKDLLPKIKNYLVDWERRIILAAGKGKVDFDRKVETATRIRMLERAAEVDAQKNLMEAFSNLPIDGQKTLKDFSGATKHTMGVIINAVRCDAKFFRDGTASIVLVAPIDGMGVKGAGLGGKDGPLTVPNNTNITGLIVDARALKFKPVLAPRLIAPDGSEVFSSKVVSKAYVDYYGATGYRSSLDESGQDPRIGPRPLVIRAIGASNDQGQLILDDEGAEKVRELNLKTGLLRQGRIVIITQ
ncbi:hypothetical protein ACFL7M_01575 [Thermodesulfobacteriota bacterium]